MPDASSTQRIALVTGANKGIGFEVSRGLARAGAFVLMGARNPALGEEAARKLQAEGLETRFIAIDLDDGNTLRAAAENIAREFGRLEILVNNAGISDPADGPPSSVALDAVERTFKINFIGSLAMTQAMLPLLRKSPNARVVNVSSGLGSLTQNSDPHYEYAFVKPLAYNASKAALNMLTVHLACELRDTPIKVNAADPGYTATDLNRHSGPQTVVEGAEETIRLALLPEDGPTGTYSDRKGVVPW